MRKFIYGLSAAAMLAINPAMAQEPDQGEEDLSPATPEILTLRERAAIEDQWLGERLDTVVPALMRENEIDMWVLVAREYLEDPVVDTMLNSTSLHARRRTILVFHDPGEGQEVERLTVSRYGLGGFFEPAWVPEDGADQWERFAEIVAERDPQKIAVNVSSVSAFADGLTSSQYNELYAALDPKYQERIVSGFNLAIGWLETRIPAEMEYYDDIVRTAHSIIGEAFSTKVITPGVTTTDDVVWWTRQKTADLGIDSWFHNSVHIFREGEDEELMGDAVIEKGDLLWIDLGIVYMGLSTDTQHLGYVLKDGETDAPEGLKAGLRASNDVQDALTSSFVTGLSGNEILKNAREKAIAQGLEPSIYTHPLGTHGHAAGTSIGFWDNQGPTVKGQYRLRPNTAWSIELYAKKAVPEWGGQEITFRTEEDAFFDGKSVRYIDGRQTRLHLIGE
ncbi:MAG: M24 family metallopeptidase [Pseudomonadota bacterium]|nr:M24 family metallopeptidase [Pseudomonadota bacterium]